MKRFPISRSESRIKIVIIMDLIKYVRQQGWTWRPPRSLTCAPGIDVCKRYEKIRELRRGDSNTEMRSEEVRVGLESREERGSKYITSHHTASQHVTYSKIMNISDSLPDDVCLSTDGKDDLRHLWERVVILRTHASAVRTWALYTHHVSDLKTIHTHTCTCARRKLAKRYFKRYWSRSGNYTETSGRWRRIQKDEPM